MKKVNNNEAAATAAETTPETFNARQVVNSEFARFAEELREMVDYFIDYRKTAGKNDGKTERVTEIEQHITATADLIGELVSIDFLEATFYSD